MKIIGLEEPDGWYAMYRTHVQNGRPVVVRLIAWALVEIDGHTLMVGMAPSHPGCPAVIPVIESEDFLGYWDGQGTPEQSIDTVLDMIARNTPDDDSDGGSPPPAPDPPPARKGTLRDFSVPKAFRDAFG